MQGLEYIAVLLALINIISFYLYYSDKRRAVNNHWRIPERSLLMWGLAGPFGAYPAMLVFRHKTRKTKFLLVPVFLVIQGLILGRIFF